MIQQCGVVTRGRVSVMILTVATLGMVGYGLYSVGVGLVDLAATGRLEWWADLWLMGAGAVLMLAAALVRVSMPGGLALAVAGLLALQSIGLHNAGHLYNELGYVLELGRAIFAIMLTALAYLGWEPIPTDRRKPTR